MNYNLVRKAFAIGYVLFVLSIFATPLFVFAQGTVTPIMPNIWNGGYWGPLLSCTGSGPGVQTTGGGTTGGGTDNKGCMDLCDLLQTFENILAFGQTIAIYIATPVLFVWGGIIIMTAGANPAQIQKGKKIMTGTLVGVLIIVFSFFIIATIVNTVLPSVGRLVGGFSGSNPFTCTP